MRSPTPPVCSSTNHEHDVGAVVRDNLELFKRVFQKPSQIYRFLRENWRDHPLYLVRNLSYVSKHRENGVERSKKTKINLVVRKLHFAMIKRETNSKNSRNNNHIKAISGNSCDSSNDITRNKNQIVKIKPNKDKVCYYNWICDDSKKTQQKTKTIGCICAWCERDYRSLDSLMIHLKCSHQRFNFNLAKEDGHWVIDMTLNSSFDGSYCGFKYPGHDLRRDFKFTPTSPQRRTPNTQLVYLKSRSRKKVTDFSTIRSTVDNDIPFSHDDDEADVDVCSGRLYYHTSTCLPVKPNEGDIDSEADMDPDWLKERTQLMIDEFTDVNEGEKEILKLWNLHIMKNYKYKGDNMIRQACLDFVDFEGHRILSKNLCKNFTLHLANLYDFGLIGSGDLLECVRKLRKIKPPVTVSPTKTSGKTKLDRNSNEHCQHSPPAKRALLNSHCNQ